MVIDVVAMASLQPSSASICLLSSHAHAHSNTAASHRDLMSSTLSFLSRSNSPCLLRSPFELQSSRLRLSFSFSLNWRTGRMGDKAVNALASPSQSALAGVGQGLQAAGAVGESDLLIVGPGVLGSLVGCRWREKHEGCKVVGQTNTTNRHEELLSLGISPVTKDSHSGDKYPYVIFCAPPSGSADYAAEVRAAAQRWNGEGSLLFTSSSALYNVHDNGPCDESSPITEKGKNPRLDLLLNAEEEVLSIRGNVVRLAGLYMRDRGAHKYWLSKGTVDARSDHFLNLIHYEDAADLCLAVLMERTRGQVFMGCDNTPVSRQDIMDILVQSGKFDGNFIGFNKPDGPLGKKMNNDGTREKLGWQPKYHSFAAFISSL